MNALKSEAFYIIIVCELPYLESCICTNSQIIYLNVYESLSAALKPNNQTTSLYLSHTLQKYNCNYKVMQPLPPHKPHWCAYLVEDYAGGSALIVHTHHAYMDGTAIVDALVHHADPHCIHDFYVTSQSSVLWKALRVPLALLLLPYALLAPLFLPSQHNPLIEGSRSLERSTVFSPPMPLAPHLAQAKALNVTFNDLIVSAALKALSAYIAKNYGTRHTHFTMGVPYSVRSHPRDGQPLPAGNEFVFLMLPMPSSASPSDICSVTKQAKSSPFLIQAKQLAKWTLSALPKFLSLSYFMRLRDKITLSVSNIPGSRAVLSYGGSEIKHLYILVPSRGPVTATVVSYADNFTVSWSADKGVIKDLGALTQLFEAQLANTQTD